MAYSSFHLEITNQIIFSIEIISLATLMSQLQSLATSPILSRKNITMSKFTTIERSIDIFDEYYQKVDIEEYKQNRVIRPTCYNKSLKV